MTTVTKDPSADALDFAVQLMTAQFESVLRGWIVKHGVAEVETIAIVLINDGSADDDDCIVVKDFVRFG